jgi:hypothetical protein
MCQNLCLQITVIDTGDKGHLKYEILVFKNIYGLLFVHILCKIIVLDSQAYFTKCYKIKDLFSEVLVSKQVPTYM